MAGVHEAVNQAPPLAGYDAFAADPDLRAAATGAGLGPDALRRLGALGRRAGDPQTLELGRRADRASPVLRTHDRYGNRIDAVTYDPAWHDLLSAAVGAGLGGAPWATDGPAHAERAVGFHLWSQVEPGHLCPVSMTYAVVPALRVDPELAGQFEPGLTGRSYDRAEAPAAAKSGLLAGMAMTEKQGGTDLRSTRTVAGPEGAGYRLVGHKWFCSAPMSDLFLTLAQAPEGLTCFALPRLAPDGTGNGIRLQRLKDKLGNRSNASAEIELDDALAWRLGPPGRGIATIVAMVALTRLDCVVGSAALQRRALAEATRHARHRSAFGRPLADAPQMSAVLADLALESAAATVLGVRLAATVDAGEEALRRLAVPAAKYWVCKRTPAAVAEALECLGGNGYVEESDLPRLYREAPLNSLWEGPGNVNALDVLRAVRREPDSLEAVEAELAAARGGDRRLDAVARELPDRLRRAGEADARDVSGRLAVALQAALLVRWAPAVVADAFAATRLPGPPGPVFGCLPPAVDTGALVRRATPDPGAAAAP